MKLFILLLLWVSSAISMTGSFQNMKPNKAYMNFALDKYVSWHEKHFPSPISRADEETKLFLAEAIKEIDHWMLNDKLAMFSIGHSLNVKKQIFQKVRVYISPVLRSSLFIKKAKLPNEFIPAFFTVNDSGRKCFVSEYNSAHSAKVFCKEENSVSYVFRGVELISNEVTQTWPSPYPFIGDWEIRHLNTKGEIVSIEYRSRTSHPSRTPREFDSLINLHVIDAHMSVDCYGVDKGGNLILYYP